MISGTYSGNTSSTDNRGEHTCGSCGKVLRREGKNVVFHGTLLHSSCFVCTTCGQQLDAFYEKDEKPYCKEHFALLLTSDPSVKDDNAALE